LERGVGGRGRLEFFGGDPEGMAMQRPPWLCRLGSDMEEDMLRFGNTKLDFVEGLNFNKKCQDSKSEFNKKYQDSKSEFNKKYQDSKSNFRKKY
jgi:hypothetical protein